MQTFLPYSDFARSATCLDSRRLFKQVLETRQIIATLKGHYDAWKSHPVVRMWRGHEACLGLYLNATIVAANYRGLDVSAVTPATTIVVDDECIVSYHGLLSLRGPMVHLLLGAVRYPPWLGDERLHSSHRSNLLRKDKDHYGQFGWSESPDLPYYWPVNDSAASAERRQ